MTTPGRPELREWVRALTEGPLDPTDPAETRYVPLQESGRAAVDELRSCIELAFHPTTQLLSGPSGSGKTTELNRLRGELEGAEFHAYVLDVTPYLSEAAPVEITEFLIVLALSAHDRLGSSQVGDSGFGRRLGNLLRRLGVKLDFPGFSGSFDAEGIEASAFGVELTVDLTKEIKRSEEVVSELRKKLRYHIGQLYTEVSEFLAELLSTQDPAAGSVLIVDGLDKVRGTGGNDTEVQESFRVLFGSERDNLRFPSHHMVYTVPIYLPFILQGSLGYDTQTLQVPVPHVRPRPGEDPEATEETRRELRKVVSLRVPSNRIFLNDGQLNRLVLASGGHLRDLLKLLNHLVSLISRLALTLPVEDGHVDEAISLLERDFQGFTAESERFLRNVAGGNGIVHPPEAEVQLMVRMLQGHMLLGHLNGAPWFEVHPLARKALGLS